MCIRLQLCFVLFYSNYGNFDITILVYAPNSREASEYVWWRDCHQTLRNHIILKHKLFGI